MEKAPHKNQYEAPHFTCVIHYTPGCEKYIAEFQQKRVAMLRKHLETLSPNQLDQFCDMLEAGLTNISNEEQS